MNTDLFDAIVRPVGTGNYCATGDNKCPFYNYKGTGLSHCLKYKETSIGTERLTQCRKEYPNL